MDRDLLNDISHFMVDHDAQIQSTMTYHRINDYKAGVLVAYLIRHLNIPIVNIGKIQRLHETAELSLNGKSPEYVQGFSDLLDLISI